MAETKKKEQLYLLNATIFVAGTVGDKEVRDYLSGEAALQKISEEAMEENGPEPELSEVDILLSKRKRAKAEGIAKAKAEAKEKTDSAKRRAERTQAAIYAKLNKRFSKEYLKELKEALLEEPDYNVEKLLKETQSVVLPLDEGGILTGLYQLGSEYKCGLKVDLKKIPVRQATIEVCELFTKNPYTAKSTGAYLIATQEPEQVKTILSEAEVPLAEIGTVDKSNQRILKIGERIQYLRRPENTDHSDVDNDTVEEVLASTDDLLKKEEPEEPVPEVVKEVIEEADSFEEPTTSEGETTEASEEPSEGFLGEGESSESADEKPSGDEE